MKTLHVPFCYYPDPIGGTEVYVQALARALRAMGVAAVIAAPAMQDDASEHERVPIRRYALPPLSDVRALYGESDAGVVEAFGRVLDEERPDVLHFHAFTRGASLAMIRQAKQRGIRVLFTYHTAGTTCQRGTLMRWGTHPCSGVMDVHACAGCTLHHLGLRRPLGALVGSLPPAVGRLVARGGRAGGLWTALRMTELVALRHAAFRALAAEVDHLVAPAAWVRDLLLHNGVPSAKITVSRHGLPDAGQNGGANRAAPRPDGGPLRIAYLGGPNPIKGPDVVLRAVRALPGTSIRLHLYGFDRHNTAVTHIARLRALAADDPRVAFFPTFPGDRVLDVLRGYHILAVPSRCLETGPLVVAEAFAAGVPVLGSALGGIAENVNPGVDGLLLPPDDIEAWRQALASLANDPAALRTLRAGIRPPRAMAQVAEEMLALYRRLLGQEASDRPEARATTLYAHA